MSKVITSEDQKQLQRWGMFTVIVAVSYYKEQTLLKYTILQEDSEHLMAAVITAIVVIAHITTALGFNFIIYKIKGVDQTSKILFKILCPEMDV